MSAAVGAPRTLDDHAACAGIAAADFEEFKEEDFDCC